MIAIVLLMLTPISWAASRSCAVDRIARPSLVRDTNSCRAIISTTAITTMKTFSTGMLAPRSSKCQATGKICGLGCGDGREEDLDDVLEDERDADGRDQRRQARGVPQRPVGEALDGDAQEAQQRHGDRERGQEHDGQQQPGR